MAHFAQLDNNNIVIQVIVVNNNDILDANGIEQESIGVALCRRLCGGTWVQTSYNARIRKHYAGIGSTYDAALDAFIRPRPFASWTLHKETCGWVAPVPMPTDGKMYHWDEDTVSWTIRITP